MTLHYTGLFSIRGIYVPRHTHTCNTDRNRDRNSSK